MSGYNGGCFEHVTPDCKRNENQLTRFNPEVGRVVGGQFGQSPFVVKPTLILGLFVDGE